MSSKIFGHQRQIDYLEKVRQKDKLAHAYLFYGPEGVGKFTLAKNLAKTLNCEDRLATLREVVCPCPACHLIDQGSYPGVLVLSSEHTLVSKKEKRKDIPIEDIRELKRQFALAPEKGKWRVAIIDQADKMNAESASAFLKLLEEPGERTLLILITAAKDFLLPTVVSRTQALGFSILPEKEMLELAQSQTEDEELQKTAVWFAAGRPGPLLDLIEKKENLEQEKIFLKELHLILSRQDWTRALLLAEKIYREEKQRSKTAEYILRLLRARLLRGQLQPSPLSLVAKIKEVDRIFNLLESTNVNPRLATEAMFIKALS